MSALTFTAKRGFSLLGDEVGAWMVDTTAETLVGGSPEVIVPDVTNSSPIKAGLTVNGSITKSAVATGADLMGYSGFGAANYLEQPYNADLDFGTGDLCFMGWFTSTNTGSNEFFIDRSDTSYSGTRIDIAKQSNDKIRFLLGDGANYIVETPNTYTDGLRHFVCGAKRGNTSEVYIDGALVGTLDVTALGNMDNTSAILRFGLAANTTNPKLTNDLSSWRAFDYAPTAAQIKQAYNKEKHLFKKYSYYTQENSSYSLDLIAQSGTLMRGTRTQKNDTTSLNGKLNSVVHRDEHEWNFNSHIINRILNTNHIRLSELREFLYATRGSEQFTFDPYGSVASEDEPVTCTRMNSQTAEVKVETTDNFRAALRFREVDE